MGADWIERLRFTAVSGSSARHARDWFVLEHLETVKEAQWIDEANGWFGIFDRTFRIRLDPLNAEDWVVEELKVKGNRHG